MVKVKCKNLQQKSIKNCYKTTSTNNSEKYAVDVKLNPHVYKLTHRYT